MTTRPHDDADLQHSPLSDVRDAASECDSHLHLGTGRLDIARIVRDVLPPDARVSIEAVKDSPDSLDDFRMDAEWLRRRE